jgi:hypothetical protein
VDQGLCQVAYNSITAYFLGQEAKKTSTKKASNSEDLESRASDLGFAADQVPNFPWKRAQAAEEHR